MLGTFAAVDREKAEALRERYSKEAKRYEKEREDAGDQAKQLEKERDLVGRRTDRHEAGEAILEIALLICSLTLLTKKRVFWASAIVFGLIGISITASGFLIR